MRCAAGSAGCGLGGMRDKFVGRLGARREEVRCGYVGVTLDVVPVVPGL